MFLYYSRRQRVAHNFSIFSSFAKKTIVKHFILCDLFINQQNNLEQTDFLEGSRFTAFNGSSSEQQSVVKKTFGCCQHAITVVGAVDSTQITLL